MPDLTGQHLFDESDSSNDPATLLGYQQNEEPDPEEEPTTTNSGAADTARAQLDALTALLRLVRTGEDPTRVDFGKVGAALAATIMPLEDPRAAIDLLDHLLSGLLSAGYSRERLGMVLDGIMLKFPSPR